jgi:hypothetical protein
MIRRLLLLALLLAMPAAVRAAPSDRVQIEQQIRSVIEALDGKDWGVLLGATWPDGRLTVTGAGPGRHPPIARHWADLAFSQVNYQSTLSRPAIRIRGNRATASFETESRVYYGPDFSGVRYHIREQVALERRRGEWRVRDWSRTVRQSGSDAEWHRRHP